MAQANTKSGQDSAVPRRDWLLLAVAALLPLIVVVVLYGNDVPLGKPGTLAYPYSPFVAERVLALPAAVQIGALLALGVWLTASELRRRRVAGFLLLLAGCVAVGWWSFSALPDHLSQHFFNMLSPSHDGAFLNESQHVGDVTDYLRDFPQRAAAPPEEMKGTRVISNPPGATLLAVGVQRLLQSSPSLAGLIDRIVRDATGDDPKLRAQARPPIAFACALAGLWLLALPFLYVTGRLFLPAAAAATVAVCALVSPMTLLFTPGKDPAQLLTTAVPLCLWLWAYRRQRVGAAAVAGGVFVLAAMVSLVHVWIAVVVWSACVLHARADSQRWRAVWLRNTLPALGGALTIALLLYLLFDWNVPASAWAAARAQARITRGPEAMPFLWQALGIPLFLLFAGPALWSVVFWLSRGRQLTGDGRLGAYLMLGSALVMLATVGFTNLETPRLWIPFVPLLLLGAALQLRVMRAARGRSALLLAVLVFVQVAGSAGQWALIDAREAETRLDKNQPRYFH